MTKSKDKYCQTCGYFQVFCFCKQDALKKLYKTDFKAPTIDDLHKDVDEREK